MSLFIFTMKVGWRNAVRQVICPDRDKKTQHNSDKERYDINNITRKNEITKNKKTQN